MLMQLGQYRFELNTAAYQQLQRKSSFRWAKLQRFLNKPALQYTGREVESISLTGIIYPKFKAGLNQINRMRQEAEKATPLILVSGVGEVMGQWVISSITEKQQFFTREGAPLKQEFSLMLEEFSQ